MLEFNFFLVSSTPLWVLYAEMDIESDKRGQAHETVRFANKRKFLEASTLSSEKDV